MSVWVAMVSALATIFSLEKSRKWIIRDGFRGHLGERLRGPDRLRVREGSGVAHGRAIVESQAHEHRHFHAGRYRAGRPRGHGAHPYGRYLEEFEVGAVYKHWPAKTVTEADDHMFCLLTMNHHPLHINDVYAKQSQQGRNVVVGPLVYSLAVGMTVSDVSGKAIANLATEELKHPAPVFHGDTLFCESEVLEVKPSRSKPDRGTVRVHTASSTRTACSWPSSSGSCSSRAARPGPWAPRAKSTSSAPSRRSPGRGGARTCRGGTRAA
jgi:acyl dehydratase